MLGCTVCTTKLLSHFHLYTELWDTRLNCLANSCTWWNFYVVNEAEGCRKENMTLWLKQWNTSKENWSHSDTLAFYIDGWKCLQNMQSHGGSDPAIISARSLSSFTVKVEQCKVKVVTVLVSSVSGLLSHSLHTAQPVHRMWLWILDSLHIIHPVHWVPN